MTLLSGKADNEHIPVVFVKRCEDKCKIKDRGTTTNGMGKICE